MKHNNLKEILPCLADKFVIELANSIQVSKDHISMQESRLDLASRLVDAVTGDSAKRQTHINKDLQSGLDSAFDWLNALTKEVKLSFLAIQTANEKITQISEGMLDLTDYSVETRNLLNQLSKSLHQKCDHLHERIQHIEAESRAERQINLLFDKWGAGRFNHLPIMSRLYVCLEQLYFGDYGDYYRQYRTSSPRIVTDLLESIQVKAIKQLNKDAELKHNEFMPTISWLSEPEILSTDLKDALEFMGDWANSDNQAFIYTASQRPTELPLYLPRILTAETLAKRSTHEIFTGRII